MGINKKGDLINLESHIQELNRKNMKINETNKENNKKTESTVNNSEINKKCRY